MSEETKPEDEVKTESKPPSPMYAIHSMARSRFNRVERAQLPQRARMKQYVGDQQFRLVRNRPVIMSEEMVLANLEELKEKTAGHLIKVATLDGRDVDLSTMQAAPKPATEKKPEFPLDSMANDKPWGIPMEPFGGDLDPNAMPHHVLPNGETPALLEEAEEPVQEETPEIPPPPPPAPTQVEVPSPASDEPLDLIAQAPEAEGTLPSDPSLFSDVVAPEETFDAPPVVEEPAVVPSVEDKPEPTKKGDKGKKEKK